MATGSAGGKKYQTGVMVGLAFVIGVLTFFITLQVINRWQGGIPADEQVDAPDKRKAGALAAGVLNAEITGTGEVWDLKEQRGKVVVVNYFATWCGPCEAELPEFVAAAKEYAPRGVVMAALSLDHDGDAPGVTRLAALKAFKGRHAVPFPILLPGEESPLMRATIAVPQTVFYDKEGRRALLIVGAISRETLERTIEMLLKE